LGRVDGAAVDGEGLGGAELVDVGEGALGGGDVAEEQVVGEGVVVGAGVEGVGLEEGFGLAGEEESAGGVGVVEGFLAYAVAGEEELLFGLVPEGEGEHAAEVGGAVGAVLFVEVEDDFGVGLGAEAVAGGLEVAAEGFEVVALAVVDEVEGAVFVGHGLVAGGEVDDGEAAMGQAAGGGVGVEVDAAAVGAAVGEDGGHAREFVTRGGGGVEI